MRWFRIAAMVTLVLTQLMAIAMTAAIIAMCTDSTHSRSIDGDPAYNGFLIFYILILVFQILIINVAILGLWIAFKNWQNNYQMDHSQRTRFVTFIALWIVFLLANCGIAIFCIIRGKEHEEEMAFLYEKFAKYNQDSKFVAHLERYQREKGCCGIYGPDDWLMVQLRSNTGGGGGGGGYQSLDYGFMQNPSTGKCHLLPPTVPMGCGRIILEELHVQVNTYAGFMLLESIIGMIAGAFMAYCFFYWLEKEVIVIPEDEVSNLIVLEPESSTDNAVADAEYFGSGIGSGEPYLGPPGDFPPGGYGSTASNPSRIPTGYGSMGQSNSGGPSRPPSAGSRPPSGSTGRSTGISPSQPGEGQQGGVPTIIIGGSGSYQAGPPPGAASGGVQDTASPYRSHYHYKQTGSGASRKKTWRQPTGIRVPTGMGSREQAVALAMASRKSHSGKQHSKNHLLHLQEKALGGKLLGEMHVGHKKDSQQFREAKGGKGKQPHHANVAITRNRNAPKPKELVSLDAGGQHHGHTDYLAEDIAEMSGNESLLDDVMRPVELGNAAMIDAEGYLAHLEVENKRKEELAKEEFFSSLLEHVAIAQEKVHEVEDEDMPTPHVAGAVGSIPAPHGGYLNAGSGHHPHHQPGIHTGSHEHAQYLGAGPHEQPHNAHHGGYLDPSRAGYLHPPGQHQNDHYLNAGSYAHARSHESNRYIDPGGYLHHDHHEHPQHESRSRTGSHHPHHSEYHDHHEDHHDHHDHHDDGGHHQHLSDRYGGSSGGGRRPSRHQSRSRTRQSSSKPRYSRGNSHNNNQRAESRRSKTRTLYAPASRSPSRFVTKDVPVHHHVIHKHMYEPKYSRSRDYQKHSGRVVVLYKNPKPLKDD